MKTLPLSPFQIEVLSAIQVAAQQRGWHGETALVEGTLVYQVPLPKDPDVAGAFFAVEADPPNILFYFLLPMAVARSAMAEAFEFVARHGAGMRFGALEFDADKGTLRVRIDSDVGGDVEETVERVIDRARRAAHAVSADWRRLCQNTKAAAEIVSAVLSKTADDGSGS